MAKVLVVDDEAGIRDYLVEVLERDGHEVHVAERLGDEGPHLPEGLVALARELFAAGPVLRYRGVVR